MLAPVRRGASACAQWRSPAICAARARHGEGSRSVNMATATWRIEMLGGLRALNGARVLTHFETRKVGVLLACLALNLKRSQPREALAEQLWPDEDAEAVRNRLRQALSSLRRELEPPNSSNGSVLISDRSEIALNPAAVTTDVAEFDAAIAAASKTADPKEQVSLLRQA